MKDAKPNNESDEDRRRPRRGTGGRKQRGFVERATALGHSGYGAESVRPHLRDQLRLKGLLPVPFPTPEPRNPAREEPH